MVRPAAHGDIDARALQALLEPLTAAAIAAARAILAIDPGRAHACDKADGSPVTAADLAADAAISERLGASAPTIPVLSEERAAAARIDAAGPFFVVDPLDGTKEFIAGRDEYTVNIALVVGRKPMLGIVAAPARGLIWRGCVGSGAERLAIGPDGGLTERKALRTRGKVQAGQPVVAAVSRSHADSRTDAFLRSLPGIERVTLGSALKFCRIAEGDADIYPRLAPTSEWDVAAGCAVVLAAGGCVTRAGGGPLTFGHAERSFIVPDFIACGDRRGLAAYSAS